MAKQQQNPIFNPSWMTTTPGSGIKLLPQVPTWGQTIGGALGTGIGSGLQELANLKMEQLKQQQMLPIFREAGMSPAEAQAYTKVPYQLQVEGLKQARTRKAMGPEPGAEPEIVPGLEPRIEPGVEPAEIPTAITSKYTPAQKKILSNAWRTGDPRLYQQAQLEVAKLQERERLAERKITTQEERDKWTQAQPFLKDVNKEYRTVIDQNRTIKDIRNEIAKGELPDPILYNFLDNWLPKFGITNTAALFGASAERINQMSKSFITHIRDIFGSRPTDFMIKAFLKTFPTLSTTEQGKLLMLDALEETNNGSLAKQRIMEEILEENKGIPPRNFEGRVLNRLQKEQKKENSKVLVDKMQKAIDYAETIPSPYSAEQAAKLKPGTTISDEQAMRLPSNVKVRDEKGQIGYIVNGKFVLEADYRQGAI